MCERYVAVLELTEETIPAKVTQQQEQQLSDMTGVADYGATQSSKKGKCSSAAAQKSGVSSTPLVAGYGSTQSINDDKVTATSSTASSSAGEGKEDEDKNTDGRVHVYRKRWLMLGLFCAYSFSNAVQWIHLNIISNIVERFYNSSLPEGEYQKSNAIDWLSMVYMLVYIPLSFPATWLLDKKGLRVCMIAGSFLNALAAWIKCASVREDLFAVLMLAQTIAAISQIWVLGIPARLAAVWFGPREVSTATSLGVFGNCVGIAFGFLIPPVIVPNSDSVHDIGTNLRTMLYGTAAFTTAIFILICLMFQKEPPRPPSRAQQQQLLLEVNADYGHSLLNLFRNKGFSLLQVSYGLNAGCFYALSTVLNAVILHYYPAEEENAGRIGLTIVLAGVVGAIASGLWLDKTHTFKATSVGICLLTTASMAAFTFTLGLHHLWLVFLMGGMLGLTMTGYLPVGLEFAAELTFPESEGTSSGLINATAQIFGIVLTMGMRAMLEQVSVLWANITITLILFCAAVVTAFITPEYRRQAAGREIVEKLSVVEINVPGPAANGDTSSLEGRENLALTLEGDAQPPSSPP